MHLDGGHHHEQEDLLRMLDKNLPPRGVDRLIYMQGNAGDSRTVLGIKGRAKPLSFDHKPQNEGEKARICAAGGFVDFGRVNGNLALSRAIGDFEFKKSADLPPEQQIVTAFPEVTEHELSDDDEFLVVACDGMFDWGGLSIVN